MAEHRDIYDLMDRWWETAIECLCLGLLIFIAIVAIGSVFNGI